MYNNGNSSKNVTGASVVDGTLENADFADNTISGDKIDGGIISNFQSTGIDDRLPTGKVLTLSDTVVGFDGVINNVGGARANPTGGDSIVMDYQTTANLQGRIRSRDWDGNVWKNLSVECNDFVIKSGGAEKMRIASTGVVDIGNFSPTGANNGKQTGAEVNDGSVTKSSRNSSGDKDHYMFYNTNGNVGSIATVSASTSYNTSSDYRLKENVVPMTNSIDRLKALKPSKFNFKVDPDKIVDGFLAHEAGEVVPECITGEKDAMMTEEYEVTPAVMDGETVVTEAVMGEHEVPNYQGIDQSKLVPLLVAALQDAVVRIETLENA
jgi:hypothetical protein